MNNLSSWQLITQKVKNSGPKIYKEKKSKIKK
jgi:hypothetical protein